MAQFYTLEEAARVLGMNPEELESKAKSREVRAFLDGESWRFRVVDIDELARRRGLGSDADLRLSDLDVPVSPSQSSSDDLSGSRAGVDQPDAGAPTPEVPQAGSGATDHDILLDDLSLPPDSLSNSSSVIIGMHTTSGQTPSESDVRLIPTEARASNRPSDSDVRPVPPRESKPSDSDVVLASPGRLSPSESDVTLIAEDTMEHGSVLSSPGDTAVRKAPVVGSSAEIPAGVDSDSDFEMAPSGTSGVVDALQPDSGSDFELSALEEESDEYEARAPEPTPAPSDSDVTAADPGFSGINLARPSDSGIGLQMAPGFGLSEASSLELTPLSGSELQPAPAAQPPGADPSKTAPPGAASSIGASGYKLEKDIFEDTDFEVDALDTDEDSEDRTVQLEAASDFELEEGEDSGSEVFAIDEEDVDQNAATALGPAVLEEEEEEEDDSFEEATSGEISSASWDVETETPSAAGARAATAGPVLAPAASSPEWGGLWVGLLGVATLFMLFLAFVSMDLVRNLYDFQGDTPASGIVKSLAGLIAG